MCFEWNRLGPFASGSSIRFFIRHDKNLINNIQSSDSLVSFITSRKNILILQGWFVEASLYTYEAGYVLQQPSNKEEIQSAAH